MTGLQISSDKTEAAAIESAILTSVKYSEQMADYLKDAKEAADAAAKHTDAVRIAAYNADYDLAKNGATAAKKNMAKYNETALAESESATTAYNDAQKAATGAAQV